MMIVTITTASSVCEGVCAVVSVSQPVSAQCHQLPDSEQALVGGGQRGGSPSEVHEVASIESP
jgi:hypothetical protein